MLTRTLFKHQNGLKTGIKHLQHDACRGAVVYIHGHMSGKDCTKCNHVYNFCETLKIDYFGYDLLGHGESDGDLPNTLVSEWEQ
jgi:pimeloyl-ACP methyl ester carboxylesterase